MVEWFHQRQANTISKEVQTMPAIYDPTPVNRASDAVDLLFIKAGMLERVGEPMRHVHFPTTSMMSVQHLMEDGAMVEVAQVVRRFQHDLIEAADAGEFPDVGGGHGVRRERRGKMGRGARGGKLGGWKSGKL